MLRIIMGTVVGAAVGAAVGYFGRCAGGTCPLSCTPVGGVIMGALIGGLLVASFGPRKPQDENDAENH